MLYELLAVAMFDDGVSGWSVGAHGAGLLGMMCLISMVEGRELGGS